MSVPRVIRIEHFRVDFAQNYEVEWGRRYFWDRNPSDVWSELTAEQLTAMLPHVQEFATKFQRNNRQQLPVFGECAKRFFAKWLCKDGAKGLLRARRHPIAMLSRADIEETFASIFEDMAKAENRAFDGTVRYFQKNLRPHARLVGLTFVHLEHGNKPFCVPFASLAAKTSLSRDAVMRAVDELRGSGLLSQTKTTNGMVYVWKKDPSTGRSYKEVFAGAA